MIDSRTHLEVVIAVVEQLSAKLNFPKLYHLDDKADYPESGSIQTCLELELSKVTRLSGECVTTW